jgi:L-methionine (R)-S-oxide reductase
MVGRLQARTLLEKVEQTMESASDRDTKLQLICELLHHEVQYYDWVGFYLADRGSRELVLGPFLGDPTEHVRIPFGRGICGQAAERKETVTIQDVSREDGHVLGELDIDSHSLSPFGPADLELLEGICALVAGLF